MRDLDWSDVEADAQRMRDDLVRVINENGEAACVHRDLSVCKDCFEVTPGLVSSYDVVYVLSGPEELAELGPDTEHVFASPGTRD